MQILHVSKDSMLKDLVKDRIDYIKPRKEGLSYITDRLHAIDADNFEILSPMIDVVKIYGVIPLLVPQEIIQKRIKFYHDHNILVSTGSTITEYSILENSFETFVEEAEKVGFDIIEVGENSVDINLEEKQKIINTILSRNLKYHWKVGRKDPRHQLVIGKTLEKIEELMKIRDINEGASREGRGVDNNNNNKNNNSNKTDYDSKIIIEANEGFNVGIYDEKGLVKWSFIEALTANYPPSDFIFETPLESQQSAMIAEFGQRVNLAAITLNAVIQVESQRRGFLSKSSYDVSYNRKEPEGGPSSKFIYYIIKTKHPIEQGELITLTHLPRRTIQNAIDELKQQGLVTEKNSLGDTRKKVYSPIHSDWL
jgi:phosphosulfolactate synthase